MGKLLDGIFCIALFAIVAYLIIRYFLKKHYEKILYKSAEESEATKKTLSMLESARQAAAAVRFHLSIYSVSSVGNEVIEIRVTYYDQKLAAFYQNAKETVSQLARGKVQSTISGDINAVHDFDKKIKSLQNTVKQEFSSLFPDTPNSFLDAFTDIMDRSRIVVSGNSVSSSVYFLVDDLGVAPSKNNTPRSPLVLDAVLNQAKRKFPNININVDKKIPSK